MKYKKLVSLLLVFILMIAESNIVECISKKDILFTFCKNNKWGCIDIRGKVVIKPIYQSDFNFSEGLAGVCLNNKFAYINKNGKVVIKPKFLYAGNFSEGLAVVEISEKNNGKEWLWGYINKQGKVLIKLKANCVGDFAEGLALVRDTRGKMGYINKKGKMLIKPQYDYCGNFSEGLAFAKLGETYGFINKSNKFKIKFKGSNSSYSNGFSEGVAYISGLGYINKRGKIILKDNSRRFSEGFSGGFSGGLCSVWIKGKCGYINKKGKVVIKPKYSYTSSFSGGLAFVVKESKINDLIHFVYGEDYMSSPSAAIIDKKGNEIVETKFNLYSRNQISCKGGYALIPSQSNNGREILKCFDKKGNLVFSFKN